MIDGSKRGGRMIAGIIYLVFGIIEIIIALRFVLLLLGASPASAFVGWIYSWSQPLVAPFANIFGQHITVAGPGAVVHSIFDWTALIALLFYAIIGWLIARLVANW